MVIRRSEMRLVSIDLCLLCGPLWESMKSRRFCETRHGVRSTFLGFSQARLDRVVVGAIDVGIIVSASTMNVTQIESNNAVSDGGSKGGLATDGPPQNPNWLFSGPSWWGLGWAWSDIASPLNPPIGHPRWWCLEA